MTGDFHSADYEVKVMVLHKVLLQKYFEIHFELALMFYFSQTNFKAFIFDFL